MKKKIGLIGLAVALVISVQAAYAAGTGGGCYSATEFEAEQGLRIHSELMVIGLTCAKMPQGDTMYRKYQSFTSKHQALISKYETDIIGYYTRQGAKNPERQLHTLRTNLANQISEHAVTMSVASFCQHFGGRIDQALAMDEQKFRRWAQHTWPQSPTTLPVCKKA